MSAKTRACHILYDLFDYWVHFEESAQVLHYLIPPAPFRHGSTKRCEGFHLYTVYIPSIRTVHFTSTSIVRTAKNRNRRVVYFLPKYFLGQSEQYLLGDACTILVQIFAYHQDRLWTSYAYFTHKKSH